MVLALILASLISCRGPGEYRRSPSKDATEPIWTSPVSEESQIVVASPTIISELHTPLNTFPPSANDNSGQVLGFQDAYGSYFLYRPSNPSDPPQTLVVIHGKRHSMLGLLTYCQRALTE